MNSALLFGTALNARGASFINKQYLTGGWLRQLFGIYPRKTLAKALEGVANNQAVLLDHVKDKRLALFGVYVYLAQHTKSERLKNIMGKLLFGCLGQIPATMDDAAALFGVDKADLVAQLYQVQKWCRANDAKSPLETPNAAFNKAGHGREIFDAITQHQVAKEMNINGDGVDQQVRMGH